MCHVVPEHVTPQNLTPQHSPDYSVIRLKPEVPPLLVAREQS